MRNYTPGEGGVITPVVLIILSVLLIIATGILTWTMAERRNVLGRQHTVQALQVAEAGVNYYRWLLAHNGDDFKDGHTWCCNNNDASTPATCGGKCGPYVHAYKDYNGADVGQYSLLITPAVTGSTITTVESTGRVSGTASTGSADKKITAKLGKRSLAVYSMLGNSPIWIGSDESTSGPLHSNGGIRFDGDCDAEVTSAVSSYDSGGANHGNYGTKPGIWGSADATCKQYWSYPEPNIDFDLFTLDMNKIKAAAVSGGIYLAPTGKEGYRLVFRNDGKIDIYKVNSVTNKTKYINDAGVETEDYEQMQNTTFLYTKSIPTNGVIFVEDDIWVEGTVSGRATVAVSRFTQTPANYARMIINDDINYVARNGDNVLGLMAEGDILVPKHASTELNIDAVMLSQNGHVYRREYASHAVRQYIEVYGSIITNKFWTWSWVNWQNENIDGYTTTNTIYDSHVTYSPPPMFPTTENYEIISYAEEK